MNELLKLLGSLMKAGAASAEARAKVASLVAKLKSEDQEAVADQVAAVDALPDAPAEDAEADDVEGEIEKGLKTLLAREVKGIKADIKTYMDEQRELIAKKAGVYHPEMQTTKRKAFNTYLRDIAGALLRNDDAKLKEMTGDATGSPFAGYTVDSELSAEIRHLITEYGVARREMQNVQLTKGNYRANNLVTDVTVFWVDEGAVVKSTEAVLGQVTLNLKKLGAIVTMTTELLEETEIDLMAFIAGRVAEGFAAAEDAAFFNGDGTATFGSFTGLLRNSNVNTVTMAVTTGNTFAKMTADDLIDMVDATPQGALANAKFYYHRSIKTVVRKLKDTTGQYIYSPMSVSGPATVWGYPEVLVEAMPQRTATALSTAFVLFGDLRKACLFGYKGAIRADRFNAGSVRNVADNADINLITTDREAMRFVQEVGYVAVVPKAVTRLRTAAS